MVDDSAHWQHPMAAAFEANAPARLHVQSQGSGPVLVLAHGLGGSARNFTPQARALRSSHKIWLYDARGHARSRAPSGADDTDRAGVYAWPALISDFNQVTVAALHDPNNPVKRPFVAGGLSLGAATALLWALHAPSTPASSGVPRRVDGLVLAAYPDSSESQRAWAEEFATAIETRGLEEAGNQYVWGPGAAFETGDAGMIRRGFLEHAPAAIAGILRQALANVPDIVSIAPALEALDVPTLIIVGGDDARSLDASRMLAARMPKSRLAIIEQAGHVVNLSQPGAFNRELTQFIDDLTNE